METALSKKIGARIREIRISQGLKQGEIADLLEMERSNFTRIESGKQIPNDKNLEKISQVLNVSLKDLYDFDHLKSDKDLKTQIKKELETLSSKELQCIYKTIKNIKLLRNK